MKQADKKFLKLVLLMVVFMMALPLFLNAAFGFGGKKPAPPVEISTTVKQVKDLASASSCASTFFKDRGKPPKAYINGLALTYVKALCQPERGDLKIVTAPLADAYNDGLAHYGIKDHSLRSVFTFLVGFGMRESSGKWCCGRDGSASNYSSETVEAGLYQTSWNSRAASSELPKLFSTYKDSSEGCFSEVWKDGVTCSDANLKNWGSGDGLKFQERSKACPTFAVEYAAVMLRKNRRHYGPINRKEVQVVSACSEMFERIEGLLSPALCKELLK